MSKRLTKAKEVRVVSKPTKTPAPREVNIEDFEHRSPLRLIYDEVRAHAEAGKTTALAYYKAYPNVVSKLRQMGLQASSRRLSDAQAKALGVDHLGGKRGVHEVIVRYVPEGSPGAGGPVLSPRASDILGGKVKR